MGDYILLSSGFIAGGSRHFVKRLERDNIMDTYVLMKDHRRPNSSLYYDREVEQLYDEWFKSRGKLPMGQTIRRIMRIFKRNLGYGSLESWMKFQSNSPSITTLHLKFLVDFYRFVLWRENLDKKYPLERWKTILTADSPKSLSKDQILDYLRQECPTAFEGKPMPIDELLANTISENIGVAISILNAMYGPRFETTTMVPSSDNLRYANVDL